MENTMKKYVALSAIVALAFAACGTGSTSSGETMGITVSGEGRVSGTPDMMTVTLGVSVLRPSVSAATASATEAADRVIAALVEQGILPEDMATSDYSVWPEYDYTGPTERVTGYRVQNTLTVRVRDLAASGDVIDAATAAGGDEAIVQGVSLSISDTSEYVVQARAKAWDDAVAKAGQLADLGGVALGDGVMSIRETYTPSVNPIAFAEDSASAGRTPILPGSQEVVVTIEVTFPIG
jgi:uncharacterized protein YggE